jgi:two-component system, chemotaxis family, chemotaxis protein CheY
LNNNHCLYLLTDGDNADFLENGAGKMTKTILVIDDSTSIRQMVAFTLKTDGYTVIEAADGAEGLAQADAHDIDLVLTDQNMPNMDGFTLVKTLRGLPEYAATPILILTTEFSDAMKAQGREAGATGWLVKPFDPHKLLEVVKKFVG